MSATSTIPSSYDSARLRFYRLDVRDDGIARLTRLSRPFESALAIHREQDAMRQVLDALGRSQYRLLVDSRQAPTRTDFELREPFRLLRREIQRGFPRVAVLVNSKLGILQANRIHGEDGFPEPLSVFDDEALALAHLSS